MPKTRPLPWRIMRIILLTLLAALLIFVFYIAVVMGQPQPDNTGRRSTAPQAQALPAPLAAPVTLDSDTALNTLAPVFVAPVMYAGSKSLTFTGGGCADVPFEEGVARVVTLTYRTAEDEPLTVQSIYPARALALLGRDNRSFTGISTDNMASMKYVAMQDASTIRLHAQGEEALYVFTAPLVSQGQLDQWTNALQLHRPE